MKKEKSNPNNKITYQINTKKRNIIIITVLTLIILLAGITTGIILYNKNNDEGSTNMVEVTTTEQEAKVTTEVATTEKKEETTTEAKKPSKKEEATTERPISGGVNALTTEEKTTEAPKHNTDKTTEAPKNEKPATQPTTERATEAPTEAPTTEHQHQWTEKSWTETIEHPGEVIPGEICDTCGFWCKTASEMIAHQEETGCFGYQNHSHYTDPTTETITHHKRVCNCGAEEVID